MDDRFNYDLIPEHMMESITAFVETGRPMGHFLTAVFANDLYAAIRRADDENTILIPLYVRWIHNIPPNGCNGSYAAVKNWKGLNKSEKEQDDEQN